MHRSSNTEAGKFPSTQGSVTLPQVRVATLARSPARMGMARRAEVRLVSYQCQSWQPLMDPSLLERAYSVLVVVERCRFITSS